MFPDARIEYTQDGRDQTLDVEVMTPHYRGAHAASKAKAGLSLSWSGRGGGRRGSARIRRGLADEPHVSTQQPAPCGPHWKGDFSTAHAVTRSTRTST